MKKSIYLLFLIVLGITTTIIYSCNKDSKETCTQDEICTSKFVDACCTNDVCVYKYDGKEYTEAEVSQLAIDLGCGGGGAFKSTENDLKAIISKLKVLMSREKGQI
jgi:hypothetical protein